MLYSNIDKLITLDKINIFVCEALIDRICNNGIEYFNQNNIS